MVLPLHAIANKPAGPLVGLAVVLACLGAARSARADESLLDDLSALRANRLSGLRNVSVTGQVNAGFPSSGRTQNLLSLTVLWPVPLGPSWQLITYTVGELVSQPRLKPRDGRVVGLGDTVVNALVARKRTRAIYWAAGPVLQLPTATDGELGSRRWAAGPSLALFVQPLPWTLGTLVGNVWGDQLDEFSAQYWLDYNLPHGWFLESNATITADWEGPLADRWTVPLAGGFGKVFRLAGRSLSASAQGSYNVKEPGVGPEWGVSLSFQLLLP
jgi:hypothetical protein